MSNPNSNSKRSHGSRADDGADDERAPKRAKDEHVSASQAAAAIEEPLPLAESAALSAPEMAAKASVPTESAEAPAQCNELVRQKSHSAFHEATVAIVVIHLRITYTPSLVN